MRFLSVLLLKIKANFAAKYFISGEDKNHFLPTFKDRKPLSVCKLFDVQIKLGRKAEWGKAFNLNQKILTSKPLDAW